ncbi:MFS transporter [Streptomyces tateyamensis]|uniref:MFS transporter n=1 Tax=Streptomyces tateyamensis TaxID=565073 RepID=A0A2V4NF53_9ACTN|nr:MFS transporter [Streptomyces tateyamensis]
MRKLRPDLTPWRSSRDFRLLWGSGSISSFGNLITYVAVPLQIKQLTGSYLAVGAIGLVELVPLIVFGLWGGALADALDRRKLVLGTEAGLGLITGLLLLNALLPHPLLWPIYLATALVAALDGLQRPALDTLVPRVVEHDQLTAAFALVSIYRNVNMVAGPALAGVLVASAGPAPAFAVDLATYACSLVLLARMRQVPPPTGAERPSLAGIAAGVRYACSRPELLGTYLVDIAAMFFAFPNTIFPFLADRLHAHWALGLLYGATAVGSLLVSATAGWAGQVHRHGRMVVLAALGWGAAMAGAGLFDNIWLVLLCLAVAGGADMVSGLGRSTMWNQSIPDELRGRLAGVELLSYSVGPQLGQLRAGSTAHLVGVRGSVWLGGLACVLSVAGLAAALPKLLAYDARTDPHAVAVRAAREGQQRLAA